MIGVGLAVPALGLIAKFHHDPIRLAVCACPRRSSLAKALADRLKDEGIEVDYKNYEGAAHEFFGMGAVLDDAKQAQQQAAAGLRKGFGVSRTESAQ